MGPVLKFLLEDRHTGYADINDLNGRMVCPVCHVYRKLLAVECREWHVRCEVCRYGRWCGQDKEGARVAVSRHTHSASCRLDYQTFPETKDRITELFGRRVRKYIEELQLEGKFMTESLVQLTLHTEFVCENCKIDLCDRCLGQCDCQHRGRIPF